MGWVLLLGLAVLGIPPVHPSAAASQSAYTLNWCPYQIQGVAMLRAYPMCCFHPDIRAIKHYGSFCQMYGFTSGSRSVNTLSTCQHNVQQSTASLNRFPTCCSDKKIYDDPLFKDICDSKKEQSELDYCKEKVEDHINDLCTLAFRYPSCCRHHASVKAFEPYATFCRQHFPDAAAKWPEDLKTRRRRATTTTTLNWCPRAVTNPRLIRKYPQCCFHPHVRMKYGQTSTCRKLGFFSQGKKPKTPKKQVPCNPNEHQVYTVATESRRRRRRSVKDNDGPPPISLAELEEIAMEKDDDDDVDNEPITVKCCGSNGVSEEKTCSDFESCRNICTGTDGKPVASIDLFIEGGEEDFCNSQLTLAKPSGRKKRQIGASMASWRINWCVRRVTGGNWDKKITRNDKTKLKIERKKICCFHPDCRKLPPSRTSQSDNNDKNALDVCKDMGFPF